MNARNSTPLRLDDALARGLAAAGIDPERAFGVLALASSRPQRALRPCTPGDGVWVLSSDEETEALAEAERVARRSSLGFFVPASGAASRMFDPLHPLLHPEAPLTRRALLARAPDPRWAPGARCFEHQAALPLWAALGDESFPDLDAPLAPFVESLIENFAQHPKGLLPFYLHRDEVEVPAEVHLEEARRVGGSGGVGVAFSVGPAHLDRWREAVGALSRGIAVDLPVQDHATDLPLFGDDGQALVDEGGRPILHPGGHGALVPQLAAFARRFDYVLVKNVDNVAPPALRPTVWRSRQALLGVCARLQRMVHRELRAGPGPIDDSLGSLLGITPGADRMEALSRPLRVCGVVKDQGQPGGGPWWTTQARSRQLLERVEVDDETLTNARPTHFNPVEMVLAVRGPDGRPWDLEAFTDPEAVLVSHRRHNGLPCQVIEHPGLWNGSMAGWNTVFVEIPSETFHPMKRLDDLVGR